MNFRERYFQKRFGKPEWAPLWDPNRRQNGAKGTLMAALLLHPV